MLENLIKRVNVINKQCTNAVYYYSITITY